MNNKYDLVIWDVDGTLLDTSEGIIASAKYIIEKKGVEVPPNDVLSTFIGPPLQESFVKVFNVAPETTKAMVNEFRSHYIEYDLLKATAYEGILPLIKDICHAGIRQGIATYKRQDCVDKLLSGFGFDDYVDIIYGSDYEGKLTKKDIIEKVIKESGCTDLDRIVMIGDSESDQKGASQIGIDFIGVSYGFGFKRGKDYFFDVADSVEDMRNLLNV